MKTKVIFLFALILILLLGIIYLTMKNQSNDFNQYSENVDNILKSTPQKINESSDEFYFYKPVGYKYNNKDGVILTQNENLIEINYLNKNIIENENYTINESLEVMIQKKNDSDTFTIWKENSYQYDVMISNSEYYVYGVFVKPGLEDSISILAEVYNSIEVR